MITYEVYLVAPGKIAIATLDDGKLVVAGLYSTDEARQLGERIMGLVDASLMLDEEIPLNSEPRDDGVLPRDPTSQAVERIIRDALE